MSAFYKEYYPFNVKFINKNKGYFIEEVSTEQDANLPKYIPCYKNKSLMITYTSKY